MASRNVMLGPLGVIQQYSHYVTNAFGSIQVTHSSPTDGRVLRMHYQWTLWLLAFGFTSVFYNWFTNDIIFCVSHFNAATQVRLDYLNICLSYPYIKVDQKKVTLLFYRYIHWALLLLAILYYIPRKLSKNNENERLARLFEHLNANSNRYDGSEKALVANAAKYMVINMRTHNGLFLKYLAWNAVALSTDLVAFFFLDWLLLGRFAAMGFDAYPYHRDGRKLTDYISMTFPPFAECTIGQAQEVMNRRTEKFGCHLTAMEIYEKVFFVLWVWLLCLMLITAAYTVFLVLFFNPKCRNLILRFSKPHVATQTTRETIENLAKCCLPGDYFVLYKMRQHFAHKDFFELLHKIGDEEYRKALLLSLMNEHPLYKGVQPEEEVDATKSTTSSWGELGCVTVE